MFLNERVRRSVVQATTMLSVESLEGIFMDTRVVSNKAKCLMHSGHCCCGGSAFMHVAGPPCVDFSSQGNQLGLLGKSMLALMCWIAMRRLLQEAIVIHENVPQCPESLLKKYLGDLYLIWEAFQVMTYMSTVCGNTRLRNIGTLLNSLVNVHITSL